MMIIDVVAAFCMLAVPVVIGAFQLREFSREQKQR